MMATVRNDDISGALRGALGALHATRAAVRATAGTVYTPPTGQGPTPPAQGSAAGAGKAGA